jgi:hypothetical protein
MSYLTQAWLEDQTSIRCLLLEITARNVTTSTEVTFYLSNMGYTTTNTDVTYLPYLTGTLQTTESLGIDNNLTMSFGDIEVSNLNGELDDWLDSTKYIWVNRTVTVYLGDPRWVAASLAQVRNRFEIIFDGVVADLDSSSRDTINIKVRDKLQRLNYPLTEHTLGTYGTWAGGQTNQDTIRPLIFGEVNNISPILIDPSKLEYMFNDTGMGVTVTATSAATNSISCTSTVGLLNNKAIVFTMPTVPYAVTATVTNSSISSTTLTIGGAITGTILIGMTVTGPNITPGTYITAGSGTSWTVNNSQNISATTLTLSGASFGNLVSGFTYYIKTIDSTTNTFTVSTVSNGATAVTLLDAAVTSTGNTVNYVQADIELSSSELVIEIRDNGVPIYTDSSVYNIALKNNSGSTTPPQGATITLGTGKFTLTSSPVGTITASVQGVKKSINLVTKALQQTTYANNIANIIALIVTRYGNPTQRLGNSDIDWDNFNAFSTLKTINIAGTDISMNSAAVGIPVLDRANTLAVCQDIAGSVNAQLFFNRAGLLQLLQLGINTSSAYDTVTSITDSDILHHSLHISNRTPVTAATKIGYCRNYTPQTSLGASLPNVANVMFNDEWYSNTVADASVQQLYKLTNTPIQKDTRLITNSDSLAVATFLNNYFKVPHTVYAFTGTSKLMGLKLGQGVTLTHNRFGLSAGKAGQVITLAPDWANGTVNVEVII